MRNNPQFWWLLGACALFTIAVLKPGTVIERNVSDYVFVVDITQSMNTEDYRLNRRPVSRLSFVKQALNEALLGLPCGSKVGWAIFTEYRTFLLLAPVEVCHNYADLASSLDHISGRMAWAGGSEIAKGLNWGLKMALALQPRPNLIFITDGHEAPPIHPKLRPRIDVAPGQVEGVIVGVGDDHLAPIPKFDPEGHRLGYWKPDEVLHTDIYSLGRRGSSVAGEKTTGVEDNQRIRSAEHLSSIKEAYLKQLASETGLRYHRLINASGLLQTLQVTPLSHRSTARAEVAWLPALAALIMTLALYRKRVPSALKGDRT